jgi:hypothetical protein
VERLGECSCRLLKKAIQRGRRRERTGDVPSGYVEDCFEPRTKLGAFFSSLLVVGLGVAGKLPLLDFFLVASKGLERIRLQVGIGLHKLWHEIIE